MILVDWHGRHADYERWRDLARIVGQHPEVGDSQSQRPCRSFLVSHLDYQSKGLTDESIKSR
jgi:hypothetical protein